MVVYGGNEPFVFISYAHADKDLVLPMIRGLQEKGFRVWYDQGIEVGDEWPDFIAEQIERCCGMVAFVSENFGESNNCREELSFAKEQEKTILVIYLEDRKKLRAGVRMRLSTLHYMNLADYADREQFVNALAKAKALKPCLGAASAPVTTYAKATQTNVEELFRQGREYFDRKEYENAIPLFRKAAESGHAEAQRDLGYCYDKGLGVLQNKAEAVKWYRKAADQGQARAQYNLGVCYDNGYGVNQDYAEAAKWYRKAAEQGHTDAQTCLGWCYETGNGVPQDYAEMLKWYRKAAEQGEAYAQCNLGLCYQYGRGVDINISEAQKWYQKAAEQGHKRAAEQLKAL